MSTPNTHLTASKLCDINSKVSTIKTELCKGLSSKNPVNFSKITPQSIAGCALLKKYYLAEQLLDLMNMLEPLSECSIKLEHPENLDINKIEQIVSKCITKELNELHNSNEFNTNNVKDDIKKLDILVNELKTSLNESSVNSSTKNENVNFYSTRTTEAKPEPVKVTNPTGHIENCLPNFITQEVESELFSFLDNQNFGTVTGGWSALNFGEPYRYTGSPTPGTQNTPVPIPDPIKKVMDGIRSEYPNCDINQCTANKFSDNASKLSEHSDNEISIRPESNIFTLSLGSQRDLTFRDVTTGAERIVTTESRSLYFMSQPSQSLWTHRMDPIDPRADNESEIRYSLTFRCVGSNFKNSSIIIGDSNTRNLKFGVGEGTFGRNIPGKRVEAFKIDEINPVDCCGYNKIFIHCGINDIKQDSITGPAKVAACFRQLRDKVNSIKLMCPMSRVYVSPILPTKDRALNERCLFFNRLLFDFVRESVGGILTHDFGIFCDSNGLLSNEMGLYKKPYDKLHLGSHGIHKIVEIIRTCVYGTLVKKSAKSAMADKLYATAVRGAPERRPQR